MTSTSFVAILAISNAEGAAYAVGAILSVTDAKVPLTS